MKALGIIAHALALSSAALPRQRDLLVTHLPGLTGPLDTPLYAGSVPLYNGANGNISIFFSFARAVGDTSNTPLAFWFTGGPGCSSMSAFLTEQGPYRPDANGNLELNEARWNQLMNMVWIDSPAGVGFSTIQKRYIPTDDSTKENAYAFIQNFMKIFPDMLSRPVYITGESYAGHYVPNLGSYIISMNQNLGRGNSKINLAGIMAGNPWTVPSVDNEGAVDFWASHGIISMDALNAAKQSCNFSGIGPLLRESKAALVAKGLSPAAVASADPDQCQSVIQDIMTNFDDLFIYDVYTDVCVGKPTIPPLLAKKGARTQTHNMLRHIFGSAAQAEPPTPPCVDFYASDYLNNPSVQAAIHAPSMTWHTCSDYVSDNYDQDSILSSVIPRYQEMLQYQQSNPNFKILVYSGDVDGILPFTGTRRWVNTLMKGQDSTDHIQWLVNNQTGGWVRSYANGGFVFTTVRGAGHMVPSTQPDRGLAMVRRFLDGTLSNGG